MQINSQYGKLVGLDSMDVLDAIATSGLAANIAGLPRLFRGKIFDYFKQLDGSAAALRGIAWNNRTVKSSRCIYYVYNYCQSRHTPHAFEPGGLEGFRWRIPEFGRHSTRTARNCLGVRSNVFLGVLGRNWFSSLACFARGDRRMDNWWTSS